MTSSPLVDRVVETVLPTRHGSFRLFGYRDTVGNEHVALVMGDALGEQPSSEPALVRLHSECLTGDALGSRRCDCGEQLDAAMSLVAQAGRGAVVYVRGHEGRGIGLIEKLRAYALQDRGLDTVDANIILGHPADARDYAAAAGILLDLGLHTVVLLSSNPAKQEAIEAFGIQVSDRRALLVEDRAENASYLATKRARMQHDQPRARSVWQRLLAHDVPAQAASSSDRVLLERYGPLAAAGDEMVVGQLAQSLDGFIASRTGQARFVSGPQDREHLHRLRALVDAVVVGASTIVSDDPQLTVRAVQGSHPTRVVLDPTARIPSTSRVLRDGQASTVWVVAEDADVDSGMVAGGDATEVDVVRLSAREGVFAPAQVLGALAHRGLRRVLVEGGGRTVSAFHDAGLLDRLYLTTAPLLIGDGVPGLRFAGHDSLDQAIRPSVRRYALGEDICTEIDLGGRASMSM
ncbi:MAG: GTP cyclohydrolase II [Ornithinimicrobium sp.]